jgi:primosomal protein N' (replication factor Y)
MTKFIKVAIFSKNDATDNLYIYKTEEAISLGDKVYVSFARGKKPISGFVFEISEEIFEEAKNYKIKNILEIDRQHSLPKHAIPVCKWMSQRYFARSYDVASLFSAPVKKVAKRKSRIPGLPQESTSKKDQTLPVLNEEQDIAFSAVSKMQDAGKFKPFLLHGVTGSGKTEVYIHIANKALSQGMSVIVLVPEISLTPQTIKRFVACFGIEKIAIMHSKLSAGERYSEYQRIKNGEANIVIGARSAIFAPLENIGAIIIDEEHETTYKSDTNPAYSAIEVAMKIGVAQGAVVILGSATPAIVSMYRAKKNIYKLLTLKNRYNNMDLPEIEIVDMRDELLLGNRSIFSQTLYSATRKALDVDKQVILFLNRRGYFTFVSCRSCGHVVRCEDCNLPLTHHKDRDSVECHFCGYKAKAPTVCPGCGSEYLRYSGLGTEQLEALTSASFEDGKIARMDADTTTKKGATERVLDDFSHKKTNILIGTQMVAKGLDFSDVTVVGIVSADMGLCIQDFRAAERTFQLISQVAGRAGRGQDAGKVIAQAFETDHYALQMAKDYDYDSFFEKEIRTRHEFYYPPFTDIFSLIVTSSDEDLSIKRASDIIDKLIEHFGDGEQGFILGPVADRIKQFEDAYRYRVNIKVKTDLRQEYEQVLSTIRQEINIQNKDDAYAYIEVNPTF